MSSVLPQAAQEGGGTPGALSPNLGLREGSPEEVTSERRLKASGGISQMKGQQVLVEFPRESGLILRCAGKAGNPFQTTQGNRLSCRDQEGRRGSDKSQQSKACLLYCFPEG